MLALTLLGLGLVVESIETGTPAHSAGLRRGDVLVSWRPAGEGKSGPLASPFDLARVEIEAAPRGPVVLVGSRNGQPLEVRVDHGGEWRVQTRPELQGRDADLYARGEAGWLDLAEAAAARDDWTLACWLAVRLAERAPAEDESAALDAFALAVDTCASTGRADRIALAHQALARAWQARLRFSQAEAAWREALRVWEGEGPAGLAAAAAHHGLGLVAWERGLPNEAEPHFRRALDLRQALAPEGLDVAATLHQLGYVASWRTEFEPASAQMTKALEIRQRLAPGSLLVAESLAGLTSVTLFMGQAEKVRELGQRALAHAERIDPGGPVSATIELELGNAAWVRGDVAAAEGHYRSALAMAERTAPLSRLIARSLNNLGNVAVARAEWEAAEASYRRATALCRRYWPESLFTTGLLQNLGSVLAEQGRLAEADEAYREGLAVGEKAAPRSGTVGAILLSLAELSQARGDQAGLEAYVERVMRVVEDPSSTARALDRAYGLKGEVALSHGKLDEAETWFRKSIDAAERFYPGDNRPTAAHRRLARLHRRQGRTSEAAEDYRRAVEALEAQRLLLGGTGQRRLGFGVRHAQLYQEAVEALLEAGRAKDAFHYWERSRARALLEMLAERDLAGLASAAYPQPLDLEQARQVLDPGTALLAYSVGSERTVLFVLPPRSSAGEGAALETVVIPVGAEALRARILAWRRLAERSAPPPEFFAEARALFELLVRPAEPHLASARRLVLCPDGPLHQLPFAALRRNGAYLAEWKPSSLAPSATVLARLTRSRSTPAGRPSPIAFGDPRATGLPRLPGGRREVAVIRQLFPASRVFLGDEATEERVRVAGRAARYVHFAGHGLVDESRPLESALALSPAAAGGDDGRLHAWEIFEHVRLDADLVTLSACRSAAGAEVAGEGVLGLTRAFHYAGARSVLASLWRVPDKSTPEFMQWFYGGLKRGLAKDQALSRAQRASIRAGHHPTRWASFQLYGDWR
jgi:CHAT domain-containing protein/Tfp pilus assembly protein PilF